MGGAGKEASIEASTGVALLDLNPAPSDLSLLLDLSPKHTLTDVGHQRDRLDRRLLAGAMTMHPSGLQVLPQAGFTSVLGLPSWDVDSAFVRQLFVLLRKMYEYVIVDLGHTLDEAQVEAMRLSNVVLLATIADVPGLRRVRWAADTAHSLGVSRDRFQVVLSRYAKRHHVNHEKVGDALNLPILTEIIDDGAMVTAARNEGTALVDMSTKAGKIFTAFARKVQGRLLGVTE
jgi:Flp pilus assembly CpaE family ATPase